MIKSVSKSYYPFHVSVPISLPLTHSDQTTTLFYERILRGEVETKQNVHNVLKCKHSIYHLGRRTLSKVTFRM